MENGKVKRRINKKALIVIILTLYLVIMAFYYCFTLPIKNINITGNSIVSDAQIIAIADIGDYPAIFKISSRKIVKAIESLDYIESASVKKNLNGTINISVVESKILFYNVLNSSIVLSSEEEVSVESNTATVGIPTLINYVPSDIYNELIAKMTEIDSEIISLISEIEYSPDVKEDITINDSRFILRMNDGNHVYIDLVNFSNLNNYKVIYSSLDEKGVLHLDGVYSGNNTITFTSFEALESEEDDETEDDNELSE